MDHGGFAIQHIFNDDGGAVLKLAGEIDLAAKEQLLRALDDCHDSKYVVVDTTDVSFLDSTGLGIIIQGSHMIGEHRFRLIPGEVTERILDLTGTRQHLNAEGY